MMSDLEGRRGAFFHCELLDVEHSLADQKVKRYRCFRAEIKIKNAVFNVSTDEAA